jgi:hypothetical protein
MALLLVSPSLANADPLGINRPSDMQLFRQDVHQAYKLREIKAAEQRERENQIERWRQQRQHDKVAQKGN